MSDRINQLNLKAYQSIINNKLDLAISCYEESLQLNYDQPDVHTNLGNLYRNINKFDKALEHYRYNLDDYVTIVNLGILFEMIGKVKEARRCYYNAIKLSPEKSFALKTRIAFLIPPIVKNREEIYKVRKRIELFIDKNINELEQIDNPMSDISMTTFYLGYHGLLNKEINKKIGDFYRNTLKQHNIVYCGSIKKRKKVKIGFISQYFRKHSVADVSNYWIANLSKKYFDITIFSIGDYNDEMIKVLKKRADKFINIPQNLKKAQEIILQQKLNILFFTDIGLEPLTYFLSFSKLAPVQITYTGHPDTTGVSTIDYYISSKLWESDDSEKHYTEKLIKFNSLTWALKKPVLKENKSRDFFGFSAQDNIYTIPQSLFKIHPDFDYVLKKIAEVDPKAKIVIFFDKNYFYFKDMLKKRLDIDKIIFLPRLNFQLYLSFLKNSDVILDTFYFNGGLTSIHSLSVGTPIITKPSEFMRGRFTYGMYKKIGIDDLIVENLEDYINKAIEIANNKDKNMNIRNKIIQHIDNLFNVNEVSEEFEKFLLF